MILNFANKIFTLSLYTVYLYGAIREIDHTLDDCRQNGIKSERPESCSFHEGFNDISNKYATCITNKILSEDMELTPSTKFKNISSVLYNLTRNIGTQHRVHTAGYLDVTCMTLVVWYKSFVNTWYEFWYQPGMEQEDTYDK